MTYLREEVKSEALVRNLGGFQHFLDVAAASFGQQVNFLDISRQCRVAYATVREYYSILEDTLLGFFLYPYLKSVRRRMSHQPRFYLFDNGVTRALMGSVVSSVLSPMEKGRLFEQWCFQEVARAQAYRHHAWKLYFWRTSDGAEVDLLIEVAGELQWALEFKAKDRILGPDLRGLHSFQKIFPHVKTAAIGLVPHTYRLEGIPIFPAQDFLRTMEAGTASA